MKSPGIPEKNELVKELRKREIEIISEIEFAYRFKGDSKIIAITGSNGKTTTTALIYHICKDSRTGLCNGGEYWLFICEAGGNRTKKIYVAEISSFQLDDIKTFQAGYSHINQHHRRSFRQVRIQF